MSNFLITGMGRSGTAFLAKTMNQSPTWTVEHEPIGSRDLEITVAEAQKRFERPYYGEVNSRLLWLARRIEVARMGVIVRDPGEVWVSVANRRYEEDWEFALKTMEAAFAEMRRLIDAGAERIDFAPMTTDPGYLQDLLRWFGIEDVSITSMEQMRPVNETYSRLDQFSTEIQGRVAALQEVVSYVNG